MYLAAISATDRPNAAAAAAAAAADAPCVMLSMEQTGTMT